MNNNICLIDKITQDSLESEHFQCLYSDLTKKYANYRLGLVEEVDYESTNALYRYADIFSLSKLSEHRVLAYRIIVRLLSVSEKKYELGNIARSIFTKMGLFVSESRFDSLAYPMPLEKEIMRLYKKDKQKSNFGDEIFTDSQFKVFSAIKKYNHFSFSGPTSFGKSFLIRNYVYQSIEDKKNIVILVPTKVLIDEYINEIRNKIKEIKWDDINLSKSASMQLSGKVNVMILTPERFNNFVYNKDRIDIDVLIVDEAHKLGDDDERSITAFKVIQKSKELYPNCKIIFSSPVISNPSVFLSSFGLDVTNAIEVTEGPVTQNLLFINLNNKTSSVFNELTKKLELTSTLIDFKDKFDFIESISQHVDSNLIYCSSKISSVTDSVIFAEKMTILDNENLEIAAQNIKDLIHDDYYLAEIIRKGVAYHNADLPKVVRNIIESLYQSRDIKYIFCTSTLLEGVNLPTGNLFLPSFSDSKKITNKTKLDFWNLAGRAGRYTKELDGNIFCIKETDKNWSKISELISDKGNIKANSTVLKKLERGQKIINVLDKGKLKDSKPERMMEQIVNIILADFMAEKKNKKLSSIIGHIPKRFHRRLLSLLETKFEEYGLDEISTDLLASAHNISLERHLNVMKDVREDPMVLTSLTNNEIYNLIKKICDVYSLKYSEKQVNRLYRIAQNWIYGLSLKQIINNTIEITETVMISNGVFEHFDKNNKHHINNVINSVISTIEQDIGYTLELYVNNYHLNLIDAFGEEYSGINLATYLELGTKDKYEISLQNYGFSRSAASEINKNYRNTIIFDEHDQVISINKVFLLKYLKKGGLTYNEVYRL